MAMTCRDETALATAAGHKDVPGILLRRESMDTVLYDSNSWRDLEGLAWPKGLGRKTLSRRLLVLIGDEAEWGAPVAHAIALACHTGAELRFLSVLTAQLLCGMPEMMGAASVDVASVTELSAQRLAWAVSIAEEAGVRCTSSLRWGSLSEIVRHTAEVEACDLIVMGPDVGLGWEHLLGGCLTRQVALKARRPVLVVKTLPAPQSSPASWRRIAVVIDGSPEADAAVEYALMLAQDGDCAVSFLPFKGLWRTAATRIRDACMLATAQAATVGVRYDVHWVSGRSATALLDTAASHQSEVMILGLSIDTWWSNLLGGSLAKTLISWSTCPVLFVPSAAMPVPVSD
jgi:nucleotide-binding universal stress UspA family protein